MSQSQISVGSCRLTCFSMATDSVLVEDDARFLATCLVTICQSAEEYLVRELNGS